MYSSAILSTSEYENKLEFYLKHRRTVKRNGSNQCFYFWKVGKGIQWVPLCITVSTFIHCFPFWGGLTIHVPSVDDDGPSRTLQGPSRTIRSLHFHVALFKCWNVLLQLLGLVASTMSIKRIFSAFSEPMDPQWQHRLKVNHNQTEFLSRAAVSV